MVRKELATGEDDPYLQILLARTLTEQKKFRGAREAVQEAIRIAPDESECYYAMANIYREQGKLKEGLKFISQAIALDPEDPYNHSMEAGLYLDLSKWQESLDSANRGLEMDADDESCLFYRGVALASLGRKEDADQDSLRLLGMDAGDPANFVSRGWVLLETGKNREATEHFTEALRIDPSREDAKGGLVRAVTQSRPILGRLLKIMYKLDDLSIWVLAIGFFLLTRGRIMLEKSNEFAIFGNLLDALLWGIILLFVSVQLLIELSLGSNSLTKNALSGRHRRGLRFAQPLFIVGIGAYVLWVMGGTKNIPLISFMFVALALLTRERFESENSWVRSKMTWILAISCVVSAVAVYFLYFRITPVLLEMLAEIDQLKESTAQEEASEELLNQLDQVLRQRKWLAVYPILAVALLASFRDNVKEWLEARAPDEGWE